MRTNPIPSDSVRKKMSILERSSFFGSDEDLLQRSLPQHSLAFRAGAWLTFD